MRKEILRMYLVATLPFLMAEVPVLNAQEAHAPARLEKERYLTNADVVRMAKAGVEEDAILASIHSSRCRFDLAPEALLALHKDGVNETILKAMIEADSDKGKPAETQQEVAKTDASKKQPKPTPEQRRVILAKLKAKHSKPAPIKSAPRTDDTDQRVAALKQQKQAVKSGRVLSASSGSGGQNTPHPGTSGSGGTGGGTLLSSGGNQLGGGQNKPRPGTPSAGGGTSGGSGGGLLAGSSNPPSGQNQPRGISSGTGGTGNNNSSGGQPTLRAGASGNGGGSSNGNPNGGGTLLASNNPPGGGSPPPAGTPGAAGGGTGGSNPFGGSNPTGGSTPAGGNNPNNPNNPSGGSTPPSRGGQPRTVGTSSRGVSTATMLSNAPVMTATPPSSNTPSQSSMLLGNTELSIDPRSVPTMGPIIKGLNSSGSYGPAVFTQDPTYNPFWVIGCHFGNSPGTAYLNSSNGQLLANLTINSWTDTIVKVSLDPSLVDAFDQDNVTLVVVPPAGQSGQKGGFSFYGMRKEVYLTSISQNRTVLGFITDTGGQNVAPSFTSPYQGFGYDVAMQADGDSSSYLTQGQIDQDNAGLPNSGKGWTVGIDRNAVYRFGGGTDTFDFSHLKPGFVVSRYQLQQYNGPVCYDGANFYVGYLTDYYDGTWNAQLDTTLQQINVSFEEEHCHISGGTDSSNSAYALNVWVVGPAIAASESPWMPGLN